LGASGSLKRDAGLQRSTGKARAVVPLMPRRMETVILVTLFPVEAGWIVTVALWGTEREVAWLQSRLETSAVPAV